ncbi:hypothetical protein LMG28138_02206 [Pararobbsia alpina]|uniref:Uncharacterized protein n=1 Tax=Pararobbsia alpina TaxID=621374 RepID=A0A6S7B3V8_9BURK|nr:hypothetical protein LMG28138_02206 [Pararobbsia alpina]
MTIQGNTRLNEVHRSDTIVGGAPAWVYLTKRPALPEYVDRVSRSCASGLAIWQNGGIAG